MMEPFTIEDATVIATFRPDTRQILRMVWQRILSNQSQVTLHIHCKRLEFQTEPPREDCGQRRPDDNSTKESKQ